MVLKKVSVIATLPGDVAVGNPKTLNVQSYVKSSLVTRPGFSFKEPRRAASAGLVRKVKIYHISGGLRDLDGFSGARIVYLNDVMSYFKYIIG